MTPAKKKHQLVNAKIPRVDAVDEPATDIPFLVLKAKEAPMKTDYDSRAEQVKNHLKDGAGKLRVVGVRLNPRAMTLETLRSDDPGPVRKSQDDAVAAFNAFVAAVGDTLPAGLSELLTTFKAGYQLHLDRLSDPAVQPPADDPGAAPVAKSAVTGRDLGSPLAAGLTSIWKNRAS